MNLIIPGTVPHEKRAMYEKNYRAITKNTDRLLLFAADQKMEHLNDDFYDGMLAPEINNPEHLFAIAEQSNIGAFATHLGLISRYGSLYPTINYIVKLNGKTNLGDGDPYSAQLWSVAEACDLARMAHLNVCGIGYTVYPGSEHEQTMLTQAAHIIHDAHEQGLLAFLWIYPRGHAVKNPSDPHLIAGAAGLGASLGADFIKIQAPNADVQTLQEAVAAAGLSRVIVSGGVAMEPQEYLRQAYAQLHDGKVAGLAVGRNIFQHEKAVAIKCANALSMLVYGNATLEEALDYCGPKSKL